MRHLWRYLRLCLDVLRLPWLLLEHRALMLQQMALLQEHNSLQREIIQALTAQPAETAETELADPLPALAGMLSLAPPIRRDPRRIRTARDVTYASSSPTSPAAPAGPPVSGGRR